VLRSLRGQDAAVLPSLRGRARHLLKSERSCVLARRGLVASSVPVASAAGVEMLRRGGNAIDAALATAATLCVVEPMSTGIGGDLFALVHSPREGRLLALNASGRAPAAASLEAYRERGLERVPERGILSATVPGAVHGWQTLSDRLGALPLADVLAPAIRIAEEGFPVKVLVAPDWSLLTDSKRLARLVERYNGQLELHQTQSTAIGTISEIPARPPEVPPTRDEGISALLEKADEVITGTVDNGGGN